MAYDQRLADVEAQLAERTRELDEARTALLGLADKAGAGLNVARSERDAARAEVGEAVKRLGETRGQLVLAEDEVRRLRDLVSSIEVLTDLLPPTYIGLSDRLASIRKRARQALGKPSG